MTALSAHNSILSASLAVLCAGSAHAQTLAGTTPEELQGVGIKQKLDAQIPLDLQFTDHTGKTVTLGQYFNTGRPVIITPVYYNCPQLCTLVLNGLVDGLQRLDWSIGDEFTVLTYSIDDTEKPDLASVKRQNYLDVYYHQSTSTEGKTRDRVSIEAGWTFLTGDTENVNALSEAIGFSFKRQPDGLIAHSASVVFATPDGHISKYMNDVLFEPRDLRLVLVDASQGAIGSFMDTFALFTCLQFDTETNRYTMSAWKLMRTMGALTLVVIVVGLIILFRRGSDAQSKSQPGGAALPANFAATSTTAGFGGGHNQ